MKHKTMTKINKLLIAMLIGCFPLISFSETINPVTIDASGPDITPARNSLLDAMIGKQCSIIDWGPSGPTNITGIIKPVPGRIPSDGDTIHSFDRPKDFEGTYVLQELEEQQVYTSIFNKDAF